MVPYLGLSVGFCCWQIWNSAAAEARSALVEICVVKPKNNLHLGYHVYFVHVTIEQLSNYRDGWGRRLTVHRMSHFIYLITDLLHSLSDLLVSIYIKLKYLHIICFFDKAIHILLPQTLSHQFSNCDPSKSQTIQPIYWLQPMNRTSGHFYMYTF